MGNNIFGMCSMYNQQETKANEITKEEEPTPSKSFQTISQRSSNYQIRNLNFLINDTSVSVNCLCNPVLYNKLINGEILEQLLDPLNEFDNNKLKEIITKMIPIISQLYTNNSTASILRKYKESILVLIDPINTKEFANEKKKEIKKILLEIIISLTEFYHFFKQNIAKVKEPYDIFYWGDIKGIQNTNEYFLSKIDDVNKQLNLIIQILY